MDYTPLGQKYLGKRFRDKVSGFEGTATGAFEYLNGCIRVTLEAMSPKGDELLELTFDAPRLIEVSTEAERPEVAIAATGGPRMAPPRRSSRA